MRCATIDGGLETNVSGKEKGTHYSTTSSSTMLTYTSKPRRVPTISFSPFMITQMREPTHRSTSSEGRSWLGFVAIALVGSAMAADVCDGLS